MTLSPGTHLGPYEIVALIGSGGMGEVYRARDPRLHRDVAVKVLRGAGSGNNEQFLLEARAVAAISHPNIMAVHDYGEADGMPYIVYELLEGESLRARLVRGSLPWRHAVDVAADIATGLAAAHAKGIVHGDMKPENVFITHEGRVTLVDFGLARLVHPEGANDVTAPLQVSGGITGTLAYMAPELLEGESPAPASDVFALGCVLYEMITGRQAFASTSPLATITKILNSEPEPIGDSMRDVPLDIIAIIERSLSKLPANRFASARDLALTLKTLVTTTERSRRIVVPPARKRMGAIAVVALLAIAIAAGVWLTRDRDAAPAPVPDTISVAVLPFENAAAGPDTEYIADGVTESLINALSQVPALSVRARASVFRLKGQPVERAARELHADVIVTGRIRRRADRITVSAELVRPSQKRQLWGRVYERPADQLLVIQEEIAREVIDALQVQVTQPVRARISARAPSNSAAYELYLRGRFHLNKRTEAGFNDALSFFARAIEKDPAFALGYSGLADTYVLLNGYGLRKPQDVVPRAIAAAKRALELDPGLAEAHTTLAALHGNYHFDWNAAEAEYRKAIALNPSYVTARQWYGGLLTGLGRFDEAMVQLEVARQLDPLSLGVPIQIGLRYYFDRRYDDAIRELRGTFELSPDFAPAHEYIGLAYEQKEMYAEAFASDMRARKARGEPEKVLAAAQEAFDKGGVMGWWRWEVEESLEKRKTQYVSPVEMAIQYAQAGDKEKALEEVRRGIEEQSAGLVWLKLEPRLDSIREDARFQAVLRRMRL